MVFSDLIKPMKMTGYGLELGLEKYIDQDIGTKENPQYMRHAKNWYRKGKTRYLWEKGKGKFINLDYENPY